MLDKRLYIVPELVRKQGILTIITLREAKQTEPVSHWILKGNKKSIRFGEDVFYFDAIILMNLVVR